ncbi:helix-turn-helix domain-containing protein [Citrifermentans bremense]|uniref:hypothetical protein n=1 Tax=Citrifermentans bremense TaxID=60035 RepID=UPI00047A883D|nr:hypothetical protein [Citrifermentans bremense]
MKKPTNIPASESTGRRRIAVAAYHGAELLDVTGPIEVFNMLNRCLGDEEALKCGYEVLLMAERPGPFASSPGIKLVADLAWQELPAGTDTIFVPGSPDDALAEALKNEHLVQWLRSTPALARRGGDRHFGRGHRGDGPGARAGRGGFRQEDGAYRGPAPGHVPEEAGGGRRSSAPSCRPRWWRGDSQLLPHIAVSALCPL